MDEERAVPTNVKSDVCSKCQRSIGTDEPYYHQETILCENCYFDLMTPRKRKTHWQYIFSVKTDYLIDH